MILKDQPRGAPNHEYDEGFSTRSAFAGIPSKRIARAQAVSTFSERLGIVLCNIRTALKREHVFQVSGGRSRGRVFNPEAIGLRSLGVKVSSNPSSPEPDRCEISVPTKDYLLPNT